MQTFQFTADSTRHNPFFFCAQFTHKEILYSVAVTENIIPDYEYLGGYIVLCATNDATLTFEMYKDEEENWSANEMHILQEVTYLIGAEIDKFVSA